MDLPRNSLKAALRDGRGQIGYWCSIDDPLMTEMAAGTGFDWLLIDAEHTAMDPGAVRAHLHAAAAGGTPAMVRPSCLDAAEIKKLLDLGAQCLMIPYVRSAAEAAMAAAAAAFAPDGIRGMAGHTRASRFGAVADYPRRARDEILLAVQIETVSALDDLDAILATPGIDAAFLGPADLAASMGHAGDTTHPAVRAACLDTLRRIRAAGTPAGILSLDPAFTAAAIDAGSLLTAVEIDAVALRRAARASAARWRIT